MLDPVSVFHALQGMIASTPVQRFVKTSRVLSREVPPGYVNVAKFGDFVESERAVQDGEVLCLNPDGGETWFTGREALYRKTDVVGAVEVDGVIWEDRIPNADPANLIGAIPYRGELGDEIEFFKPVWGTTMRVNIGGWIAINLSNPQDIWSVEGRAMQQIYRPVEAGHG